MSLSRAELGGPNADGRAAREYHAATSHTPERLRASQHTLDWPNQPLPYKIYTSLEPMRLPDNLPPSPGPALAAIAGRPWGPSVEQAEAARPAGGLEGGQGGLERADLARVCLYANGVTKLLRWARGEMAFRAAACTGALYHIELYLVCGPLADLEAGVYHYAAHDHALRRLRRGDFRPWLVEATGAEPNVAQAPVVVACTSTFWRNTWKYQARAYRHSFWDGGTVLANLLAVAAAQRIAAHLVLGFADDAVNRLLDVDPTHEATICLVALGAAADQPPPGPLLALEPLGLATRALSAHEVEYPEITAMHAASSLGSGAEAVAWRAGPAEPGRTEVFPTPTPTPAPAPAPGDRPPESIEQVILRRGSTRRFARQAIELGQLWTLLGAATEPIPSDVAAAGPLAQPYLIAHAVDGLAPGAYAVDRQRAVLEPLRLGSFRDEAGYLDLGQELAADAAINVYWLADLEPVLDRFGNRGYRAAQLEAAVEAGRMYLAAYALRLGATGLTFFDDEVTRFFSPHAAGKSVLFLMAVGHKARHQTT